MADLMSIIKGRRSIRRYDEKEIPQEDLQQVLESIQWSPSWANTQCWEVIVVRDRTVKEKLQGTLGPTNPASKAITQAPLILALCGKVKSSGFYKGEASTKFGDWFMFDLGLATQSLCLAAQDRGLGTVIVGSLDHNKAKEILGVGEEHELVALIPLGYPAKESSAPKRREISEFTHYEKF
ncbi:MAG: nitroreductase family protein [Proteobacteria bacterium]|nr:nitroreductase family protein [Pseudomonadota bacterium]